MKKHVRQKCEGKMNHHKTHQFRYDAHGIGKDDYVGQYGNIKKGLSQQSKVSWFVKNIAPCLVDGNF